MPLFVMAETTTDRVVLTAEGALQPGGEEVKVTVSLEGSRKYTAYNMDITLPQGVELNYYQGQPDIAMYTRDDCAYPFTSDRDGNKTFTHAITATYGEVGEKVIRVLCNSSKNDNFKSETGGKLLTLYLKATAFAKPGDTALMLSNCKFATYDANTMQTTGYVPEQTTISGITIGTTATLPLAVSPTAKWATLMLPFATTLPAGVKAYSCASNDASNLILTPEESIEAYTPYIIYSENGCDQMLNGTVSETSYPESDILTKGYLRASITQQTLAQGYVLQKQNETVQFYKVNSEQPVTVKSGKCWVELPSELTAKAFFGITIGDATYVKALPATNNASSAYHTLNGIRVKNLRKGNIYIHNGRRFTR